VADRGQVLPLACDQPALRVSGGTCSVQRPS
jgi:hypothetical protein